MLVLSRKESESICIGNGIEIFVVSVKGGRVRLGVAAPPEVTVLRREIIGRFPREWGMASAAPCVDEGIQ